jgi:hypothetical protein
MRVIYRIERLSNTHRLSIIVLPRKDAVAF